MRSPTVHWRSSFATILAAVLSGVVVVGLSVSPAPAQEASRPDTPGAPASDVSNIPKPILGTLDRVNLHATGLTLARKEERPPKETLRACFLR